MDEPVVEQREPAGEATPAPAKPWYLREIRPDRRVFGIGRPVRIFMVITIPLILLYSVTCKPLWCLGWRYPFYAMSNFMPVRSASGQWHPGAAWIRAKDIRIYSEGAVGAAKQLVAVRDMQGLVDELGLDITVTAHAMPEDARRDLDAATVKQEGKYRLDFQRLMALRLEHRGQRYAEIFLTGMEFADNPIIQGKALCGAGLVALRMGRTDNVVRHEGAHLLGYDKHDDFPYYIVGYRESWLPEARDTMMMFSSTANRALSPRAKDALHHLWIGLEKRHGVRYFKR
ncbi:MAG TPA: hypothetical protein PLZ36_08830 [Armatimonadota bacterium]|nr:hypothetical protein [Armatimonadota bacterium]HOS44145.1 hypothetical protein [Armatimonadota bacterium]